MPCVCVVDDDPGIRLLLRLVLEEEGFIVQELEDGGLVLDFLWACTEPVVVLLDYRLPTMDGADILTALAMNPTFASRHAYVLMSGARFTAGNKIGWPEDFASILDRLQVTVLEKPFDIEDVIFAVKGARARLPESLAG
jgi:CheY-like chemotaxis protein